MENEPITLTKLEAARRQLGTAVSLWFAEGDPVSTHVLAYAAYEIIHVVSKKKNRNREGLLFDSPYIRDDKRSEFNIILKKHANFFKHANNDADATIDFLPQVPELFIMYAIFGIELCGEQLNDAELAFMMWHYLHDPAILNEAGREKILESAPVNQLKVLRDIRRDEFLKLFQHARRIGRLQM